MTATKPFMRSEMLLGGRNNHGGSSSTDEHCHKEFGYALRTYHVVPNMRPARPDTLVQLYRAHAARIIIHETCLLVPSHLKRHCIVTEPI
ncbi:jg7558 [Pararge aegeria aegeria]|uniref:Jg7558 protein n=1 Tax=Pararge aegeria aegeria TaxID=348720 RepID=A0A8S4SD05_9NEOP|nr:jg7558 [Pararge aegeria aegeria]